MSRKLAPSAGLLAAALVLCGLGASCSERDASPNESRDASGESSTQAASKPRALKNLNASGQLFGAGDAAEDDAVELKPLLDGNGQTSAFIPLPKSWEIHPGSAGNYTISAPGGVRVNPSDRAEYAYADDPFALQTLQQTGKQIAPVLPVDQIIRQALVPAAQAQGYTLVDSYPLPGVQQFWEAFGSAMPNTGSIRSFRVMGTDWKAGNGNRSMIVILQTVTRQSSFVVWSVDTTELEAPATVFESAKQTYLDGLAHTQMNEEWQRAQGFQLTQQIRQNQQESERWMRISAQGHQQRMADIAAAGNAARAIGESNSAILDQSQAGYEKRSAMQSAGQSAAVDGIREVTTVANPVDGQRFKVESGYQFYWSDGQGGYFGTNDANYDPRTDSRLNGRNWVKLQTRE